MNENMEHYTKEQWIKVLKHRTIYAFVAGVLSGMSLIVAVVAHALA